MGHGYFRTSQTSTSSRQRDKRGKDSYSYQHNYVDRVRLEDTNGNLYQQQQQQQQQQHHHASHHPKTTHDPRCPQLRAAGWRHTHKSVSHLDLATSCHSAAGAGIDHRHRQLHHHQSHHHQHHHQHLPPAPPLTPHAQPHWTQCRVGIAAGAAAGHGQLRNARSLDYTQLEREENALDIAEFYWHFDAEAPHEPIDNYAVNDSFEPAESPSPPPTPSPTTPLTTVATTAATDTTTATTSTTSTAAATVGATTTVTATYLDFGSESCSLRRSRSLAVIREETFSDLQIGSANSSRRRSQLIPRARLVNRGFFRESPRLHNKQQQQQQQQQQPSEQPDADAQSHSSGSATTCDSHQQQQLLKQQHQQQKQRKRQQQQQQRGEARDFDVYYDNLKRLDALALGLSEQLHPWHNDKSDLESLNSDYFKNSLHQNHADQLQPSSLEFEALEQAVTLLSERPRIYQSRRQQQQQHRLHHHCHQRHIDLGGESCPEHSQSSVFPETTTSNSNSDDQTDSPSLSEQEYDLTHIEQIFQQGESGEVEECYELISLTTTTRTRFESSEEEGNERELQQQQQEEEEQSLTTPTDTTVTSDSDGTLKRGHSEQLDKLIAYDSVYLSSEDSSECTLIGESCESFEQRTSLSTECEEGRSLLHISIEDTVYEPQPKQHKKQEQEEQLETQIFTQILKIEQPATITSSTASKPRILSVVEKRKQQELKQQPVGTAVPPELKRQATDTFVVTSTHKSNLVENQYHSLPDVNIGVSLKVCESIDKELRTSYNLQRQQQRKESKRQKATTEQSQNQVVTRAETYDSIRRFGRAHQKARQIEYEHEERERQREKEASTQEAEKETTTKPAKEANKVEVKQAIFPAPIEVEVRVKQEDEENEEEELPLPPPPPPLTEAEDNDNDNDDKDNLSVSISLAEQPKEAPHIEVANFSKLIERRAQEIRQRKEQTEQQQPQQQQSFRIIVTDAQNNIIATEAIQEETKPSVNCTPPPPQPPAAAPTHSHSQRSLRRSSSTASGKPPERRVLSAGAPIYKARPIKVLATSEKMSRPQILHVVDSSSSNGHDPTANGSLRRRSSARSIASTVSNAGGEVAIEYLQKVDAVKCYWNKLAAGSEPSEPSKPQTNEDSAARLHFQLGDRVTEKSTPNATNSSADYCSIMPPSIEIVELGDGAQKATIVSAAPDGHDDDDDEDAVQFDHIRYKVLKSQQLIRSNILTARNKKEAQFDGLIQYLQDYSFQELLSNNNVVIVEPVRTKIERPLTVGGTTSGPTAKPPKLVKQQTTSAKKPRQRQIGGAAAKRHFFYQPVRVNRELYEDELPDPDTVRNVRRFFEQHVLPTPGQGILVQSQQKFGGSACQLSPKTRRARGYRYLTIDTSYGAGGEEQPKGMELLEEHKVKQHWDNASLSSGISSGDLSSPCGECHLREPEAMPKETPLMACKGVHVLDVVRRHNSNAANAKARAGKLASRRTWCVGGGGGAAGDSRYRQIYEQAKLEAEAQEEEREDNQHNGDGDDDGEDYDDDVETDMCESYYVSNDVLAKIRECGSTVTYYGGRVLERGLPTAATATGAGGHLNPQLLNGCGENAAVTRTRSRVRQIEACNECIEQQQHQQQDQQQDSYQGIKFKLVKSNSCSSRLELAGTEEEEANTMEDDNTEVVRKMVHHFECNRPTMMADGQANVTINSQSTAGKKEMLEGTTSVRRQVTVNNHINMTPQECERLPNGLDKQTQLERDEEATTATTYQSQAMNIRLDLSAGRGSGCDKPNNNSKVCRNRNVDLAYTLAKPSRQQQQQQQPVIGNPGTPLGNQKLTKQYNDAQDDETAVVVATAAEHVKPCQQEVIGREQIIVPIEIHQNQTQTQIQTQAHGQERRLSNASSSASIVDKTVVRHYVANDKSIYERRKYDEIEFEEFEIYDPAKEQERLEQEQQQQQQEQHQQQTFQAQDGVSSLSRRQTNDGELYDSLDDRM